MLARHGSRLYLFGSRARDTPEAGSDYDIVAVSERFVGIPTERRAPDRYFLWRAAGGWGIDLDLHCLTREAFERSVGEGQSLLGCARRDGELLEIPPAPDGDWVAASLRRAEEGALPAGVSR
jgi:hypothetical protein